MSLNVLKSFLLILYVLHAIDVRRQFDDYIAKFNKGYISGSDEYEYRLKIFIKGLQRIKNDQENSPSSVHVVNKFTDQTDNEIHENFGFMTLSPGDVDRACLGKNVPPRALDSTNIPDSVDWRTHDPPVVTIVRDQHKPVYCGSCWAFSATGNLEGQWALAGNPLVSLSEQSIVDCSKGCCDHDGDHVCNNGCKGGWQFVAWDDMIKYGGLPSFDDYPYTARDGTCRMSSMKPVAKIANFTCITKEDSDGASPQDMAAFCANNGPMSIAMDVSSMMSYKSGIWNPSRCSNTNLGHALLIVGYGTENGTPYWIIKNSWGVDWGEAGYLRMVRGKKKCGVAMAVSSAVVAK